MQVPEKGLANFFARFWGVLGRPGKQRLHPALCRLIAVQTVFKQNGNNAKTMRCNELKRLFKILEQQIVDAAKISSHKQDDQPF